MEIILYDLHREYKLSRGFLCPHPGQASLPFCSPPERLEPGSAHRGC